MPARKIAISLDPDLAEAAKERIRWAVLAHAVTEDEAEFGGITPEMVAGVHRPAYVSAMEMRKASWFGATAAAKSVSPAGCLD